MKKVMNLLLLVLLFMTTDAMASVDPYKFSKTKAFCLFQQGDYERAIYSYEKIIASGSNDVGVFYNLGCLYVKTEDYARAIKSFERVLLSMAPIAKDASYNLSIIYGRYLKDADRAKFFYAKYQQMKKSLELSYVDN